MKIKPFFDDSRQAAGVDASAGKKGNKRFRKRFSILKYGSMDRCRKAAEKWVKTTEEAKESEGLTLVAIPQEIRPMIIRCLELLEDYPATLEEAVMAYIRLYDSQRPMEPWTYSEAADDWLEQKKGENRREKYTDEMKRFIKLTKREFGSMLCDQIGTDELRKFIRTRDKILRKKREDIWEREGRDGEPGGLAPVTWRNFKTNFSLIFNCAIQQKRAATNPAIGLPEPADEDQPVEILTIEQVKSYLSACELRWIPYVALGFFAGIRPYEAIRLRSKNFHFDSALIEVAGFQAKSRRRRLTTMSPNLAIWLKPVVHLFDEPPTKWMLRGARERAEKRIGIDLPHDVFRHCYASYHLAKHRDAASTALELGHEDQDMLFDHYREVVKMAEAIAYFSLLPSLCQFTSAEVRDVYAGSESTLPPEQVIKAFGRA